jgi:protease-4
MIEPKAGPARPLSFWVALVLALLLTVSVVANVLLVTLNSWLDAGSDNAPFEEEHLAGDRQAADKILDIALTGAIADVGSKNVVSSIIAQLDQARKDDHVKGLLIEMNTPGGGITASDILYHEVDRFRKDRKVPVVVLCKDLTASGGYYVSMAADHIMAHQTSLVGSIGVIAEFTNVQGLMEKVGVKVEIVKSQRADGSESFKDIGSPFRQMKPAERAMMQRMVEKMWNRFVDVVATGREGKLTRAQIAELADGRVWTGQEALDLHLVDSIGYREDAWKKATELAHDPGARLVSWHRPSGLFGALLGARGTAPDLNALLDRTIDPALSASPRLLYLWTAR